MLQLLTTQIKSSQYINQQVVGRRVTYTMSKRVYHFENNNCDVGSDENIENVFELLLISTSLHGIFFSMIIHEPQICLIT